VEEAYASSSKPEESRIAGLLPYALDQIRTVDLARKLGKEARLFEHLAVALLGPGILAEPVGDHVLDRRERDRAAVLDRQERDALGIGPPVEQAPADQLWTPMVGTSG
jgi:hypothetical protein